LGARGRIEILIPFNAPPDRPCRLLVDADGDLFGASISEQAFPVCDQYTIQGDAFSRAILEDSAPPTPLEDSLQNMAAIEAVFRSARTGAWETPRP
jgi:hypothetical protein